MSLENAIRQAFADLPPQYQRYVENGITVCHTNLIFTVKDLLSIPPFQRPSSNIPLGLFSKLAGLSGTFESSGSRSIQKTMKCKFNENAPGNLKNKTVSLTCNGTGKYPAVYEISGFPNPAISTVCVMSDTIGGEVRATRHSGEEEACAIGMIIAERGLDRGCKPYLKVKFGPNAPGNLKNKIIDIESDGTQTCPCPYEVKGFPNPALAVVYVMDDANGSEVRATRYNGDVDAPAIGVIQGNRGLRALKKFLKVRFGANAPGNLANKILDICCDGTGSAPAPYEIQGFPNPALKSVYVMTDEVGGEVRATRYQGDNDAPAIGQIVNDRELRALKPFLQVKFNASAPGNLANKTIEVQCDGTGSTPAPYEVVGFPNPALKSVYVMSDSVGGEVRATRYVGDVDAPPIGKVTKDRDLYGGDRSCKAYLTCQFSPVAPGNLANKRVKLACDGTGSLPRPYEVHGVPNAALSSVYVISENAGGEVRATRYEGDNDAPSIGQIVADRDLTDRALRTHLKVTFNANAPGNMANKVIDVTCDGTGSSPAPYTVSHFPNPALKTVYVMSDVVGGEVRATRYQGEQDAPQIGQVTAVVV